MSHLYHRGSQLVRKSANLSFLTYKGTGLFGKSVNYYTGEEMVAKKESGCRPGKKPRKTKIDEDSLVRFNVPSTSRIDRLFTLVKLSLLMSFCSLIILFTLIIIENWEFITNIPYIIPELD